jgi:hypothetical protein
VTLVMLLTILIVKVQIQRCIGTVFRNGASPDAQTGRFAQGATIV